jgi:hypothetical protein
MKTISIVPALAFRFALAMLCLLIGHTFAADVAQSAARPGERPSDREQITRIASARAALVNALHKENASAIANAEAAYRKALGKFVGVPEGVEPRNAKSAKVTRPSADDFRALTRRMKRMASGSEDAKKDRMELRNAAYLAIGLLALAESNPNATDANAYRQQAAIELDWLIARQAKEGYFPYPADPVAAPNLQRLAARMAKKFPEKVRNGYIYADEDGAQFDAGCAAYALAYGFQILKTPRYLEAARKAGDWALTFPLSYNWNYNAFSVWQLAKIYEVTKEEKYRQRARDIALLGVLPGQLDSGRWSDQHNARSVYHWIMVRGLVELLRVMPADSADSKFIRERTKLAVQSRVDDILAHGGSNSESALVALVDALSYFGPNKQWHDALDKISASSPYAAGWWMRYQAQSAAK